MKYTDKQKELILSVFNAEGLHELIAEKFHVKRRWVGKVKDGKLHSKLTGAVMERGEHSGIVYLLFNGNIIFQYEYRYRFERRQRIKYWNNGYMKKHIGQYSIQISPNLKEKELNKIKLPEEKIKTILPQSNLKFINPKLLRFENKQEGNNQNQKTALWSNY